MACCPKPSSHYLNKFWLDLLWNEPRGTKPSEIWIVIHIFKKGHLKMSSAKWWPFCFDLNESTVNPCVMEWINNSLQWRHNGLDGVSNHQPHHCLLSRLFGHRPKKTSKLRVTGLCAGNSPGTGEYPAQMASNAENVSIWWRHHVLMLTNQLHC